MDNKTIVAIEIASSKIKGAVGSVSPDGRVTVLAVDETPSHGNVRYGRVQNIREVSASVSDLLRRLEETAAVAPRRIRSLSLSLGGRSLGSTPAKASLSFTKEREIVANHVERLALEASNDIAIDRNVEAVVPRTYYVNKSSATQPIGMYGESLRGEFTVVSCAKETRQNLARLRFDGIEPENVKFVVTPLAVADFVLTPEEKSVGTVFADFGAETTTVAVYKNGSLAFLCTLPLGSRLIVRDLMTVFSTTEENAEEMIRRYSADAKDKDNSDVKNYIHARAGEIMANVQHQLEVAGFGKEGIVKAVITGGATNIPDIPEQFTFQTKLKARIAEMPGNVQFFVPNRNNSDNVDIVALLVASAPLFRDSCLTNIEIPVEEPEEEPDTIIAVARESAPVSKKTQATIDEDDDKNLFKDDEDDETPKKPSKSLIERLGFRKKNNKVDIDEFDEQNDNGTYDKEPEEEEPKNTDNGKKPDTGKLFSHFNERLSKIFVSPETLYEDDNTDK